MCSGNPGNSLSIPGGTVTQSFTVPAGVANLNSALVQIDPNSRVTAHLTLFVNGQARMSTSAAAIGDTYFYFSPTGVSQGDQVTLSINFTARALGG